MEPRLKDIEAIYHAALEKAPGQDRTAYLDAACGTDTAIRCHVDALLAANDQAGAFLETLPWVGDVTLDASPVREGPGTVIGHYKLLEKIGEGGMAVVYMAQQETPFRRRVAMKIIKLGMDTKSVIARFEAERQALALMDHPNIAKVLDAGATQTGRSYFVMELVRGVSITDYCDQETLSTRQRLGLFVQVCNAVQHAHQKGIIHRDIKPSNVMVTLHDGTPVPKVIDFGIAKATNCRLTEKTIFTRYAQMIGTPAYMSPEQAEMSGLDVDTRTDIYSLGVLLYQLLTGTTPFGAEKLHEAGYTEMQRIIRETDPLKPSTRIRTLGKTLTSVAASRHASPESLRKLVKGDLDWIVMKCLEKDRRHRYETAHALAEDIDRHLRHEPIAAGSPGVVYRIRKFLRRHRVAVMTVSAAAVVLAGLLLATIAHVRLTVQRTRVDHQESLALVEDLLSRGDYQHARSEIGPILSSRFVGPEARLLHARLLLELEGPDASVEYLKNLLHERPEVAANAHFLLAWIYLEADPSDPRMTNKADIHLQHGERLLPRTAEAYLLRAMTAQTVPETVGWLNEALELDGGHYAARRARALAYRALGQYRDMETEASVMIGNQPKNPIGYSLRAVARRETALTRHDRELLSHALADHDRAAGLAAPRDKRLADLCDQRRQTLMRMGKYSQALVDAQTCLRLKPQEPMYHFRLFCILVALGEFDAAQAECDKIVESGLMEPLHLNLSAAKYVFDTLCAGQSWYPNGRRPEGPAFEAMHRAAEEYAQLAGIARRIVPEGFHPNWSPDGTQLVYSRGMLGASGIEILDLETSRTRLLTVPGKDPAWSPDGQHIVYVRDRQVLSLTDLAGEREGAHRPFEQEEVWMVRADGTGRPRFLAQGGWPDWSRDSSRVYYHSRLENKIYSVAIDPDHAETHEILACSDLFPVVSPDEKYVAFMDGTPTFHILDVSRGSVVASWPGPPEKARLFFNWSPDGRTLSVGSFWHGGLWMYDVDHREAAKVVDGSYSWCSWSSPDMSRMAIEKVYGQYHHEIWIADVNDGILPHAQEVGRPGKQLQQYENNEACKARDLTQR